MSEAKPDPNCPHCRGLGNVWVSTPSTYTKPMTCGCVMAKMPAPTVTVSSTDQSGGITAHTVNEPVMGTLIEDNRREAWEVGTWLTGACLTIAALSVSLIERSFIGFLLSLSAAVLYILVAMLFTRLSELNDRASK